MENKYDTSMEQFDTEFWNLEEEIKNADIEFAEGMISIKSHFTDQEWEDYLVINWSVSVLDWAWFLPTPII